MRSIVMLIGFLIMGMGFLQAQDPGCWGGYRSYKTRSDLKFFIPEFIDQFNLKTLHRSEKLKFDKPITEFNLAKSALVIYESPVTHTAFFCRMEDITQKKLGVMIQFHVGDYNSLMDYKIPR